MNGKNEKCIKLTKEQIKIEYNNGYLMKLHKKYFNVLILIPNNKSGCFLHELIILDKNRQICWDGWITISEENLEIFKTYMDSEQGFNFPFDIPNL